MRVSINKINVGERLRQENDYVDKLRKHERVGSIL